MKIIALTAENIKKLVAVEIRPDRNLVQITGKNGQGKTSVLDSIWWALKGAATIQSSPIRAGQERATIKLDLGELVVTRTFRAKEEGTFTTSIAVENADGAKFPSPQTMLDNLLGELTFDPLAFSRMKPKEQFDSLRRFVPGVDFDAIDAANKADYDKRRDINRDAAAKRAQAGPASTTTDLQPIDEAALVAELKAAGDQNSITEQRRQRRLQMTKDAEQKREAARMNRIRAEEMITEAEFAEAAATEIEKKLTDAGPLPEIIDTSALVKKISDAQAHNATLETAQRAATFLAEAKELERQSEALTAAMEKRNTEKRAAIEAADLPVPGLGFGDGHVLFNGIPFDQASDADQLRISIAIAMAANPKLRIVRVRDGSLLDDDAMKILEAMADENDYQVWIERVDSSGKIGFVLEDGHLKVEK